MVTDLDGAKLVAAQYAGQKAAFDIYIDPGHKDWSGIAWAAKKIGAVWFIVLEGSHDAPDWAKDFRFLPQDVDGVTLHRGFNQGMRVLVDAISLLCVGAKVILGHSLGAARADILTWYLESSGDHVLAYIRWGEPAPGYGPRLGTSLVGIPGRSYRNVKPSPRHANDVDLVTEVPPAIFDARHPQPFTDIYAQPDAEASKWGLLSWHHFKLYLSVTPDTVIIP